MKFKNKIYLVIFLSITISGFSIFLLSYNIFSKEIMTLEKEKIRLLGDEAEGNIEEKIDHIVSILNFLEGVYHENRDKISVEEREKKMLSYMKNIHNYELKIKDIGYGKPNEFMVFDKNTENIVNMNEYDSTRRPWYIGALNARDFYVSETFLSLKTKQPIITISKKIVDRGKVVGVLVIGLEISTFSKALKQYRKESKEVFFLLDKNNKLILSTNSEREKYIGDILKDKNYKIGKKYFVIKRKNGKNHYYIHRLKNLNLTLIASIREKELYYSIYEIRNYILGVVVLVLLIITVILLIFYRKYSRTLNKLSEIINVITTGDYTKSIDHILDDVDEKGELSKIKKAIQNMNYEIIKREENLRIISERDPLLNIFNRRTILKFIDREMKKSRTLGSKYTLIMFDIDNFKEINDKYGHQFGDVVLLNISKKISYNIKATDKFGRLGGDEFLILLPSTNINYGRKIAERIRSSIASMLWEDRDVTVTVSVGVTGNENDKDVKEVLERVDKALYKAKNNGRNRIEE
jgi:diguanylate cyclase (GGDEF)-like protein